MRNYANVSNYVPIDIVITSFRDVSEVRNYVKLCGRTQVKNVELSRNSEMLIITRNFEHPTSKGPHIIFCV